MTTTRQPPRPAEPDTRRRLGRQLLVVAAMALIALLPTPLWVSGWTPFGQAGPAVVATDQAAPLASAQEVPGEFHDGILEASWSGSAAWPLSPASGTVIVDAWVGRMDDVDPQGDYYAVHLVTSWTHSDGMAHLPAPVRLRVVSDSAAVSNLYGGTRSFVSAAGCDAVLALAPTVGADGHQGTASACRGYGMRLLGEDATSAVWQADQPAGLRQVEVVYSQKVREGALPVWTVELTTPAGRTSDAPWRVGPVATSTVVATVRP